MKAQLFFIFALFPCVLFPSKAHAEVIVHDLIAVQGEKTFIRVETRGKFFRRGGEVVQLIINGKPGGSALSGGDGFAFKQYAPGNAGIYRISAKSGADEGAGLLLSLKKGTGIVFVEVEGSLFEEPFSRKPRKGSAEVLREINKRFPVVFLKSGMAITETLKVWLRENGYPEAPVIPWERGQTFGNIYEKGLRIRAIIGSPDVISSAGEYHPKAFSFAEAEGAREVRDWEEIRKILRAGGF